MQWSSTEAWEARACNPKKGGLPHKNPPGLQGTLLNCGCVLPNLFNLLELESIGMRYAYSESVSFQLAGQFDLRLRRLFETLSAVGVARRRRIHLLVPFLPLLHMCEGPFEPEPLKHLAVSLRKKAHSSVRVFAKVTFIQCAQTSWRAESSIDDLDLPWPRASLRRSRRPAQSSALHRCPEVRSAQRCGGLPRSQGAGCIWHQSRPRHCRGTLAYVLDLRL